MATWERYIKMSIKSWVTKAGAVFFLAFTVVQVHAFMVEPSDISVSEDISEIGERVAEISDDLAADEITPKAAIEQIDLVIDEVDSVLDTEPKNEEELMELRDALVDLRADVLEHEDNPEMLAALGDNLPVLPLFSGGGYAPAASGGLFGGGGVIGSGGGFGGGLGGAVGGGGLGGFLTSPLGLGSIAGGIIAIAVSGDDDPEPNSVPAMGN